VIDPSFAGCFIRFEKATSSWFGSLIVWLGQRVILLETMETIREAGGRFESISEPWADTTSHSGKMIMTIFAGIHRPEWLTN